MKTFYIEDKWTYNGEANDIIKYGFNNGYDIIILNYDELMKINSNIFINNYYFVNTDIVQHHLKNTNKSNIVPDTYDDQFNNLYYREIEKMTFSEYVKKYEGIQRFIKPFSNNKDFDGTVIQYKNDFNNHYIKIPNDDTYIYTTPILNIKTEVRLLIGNNKLYGHTFMCGKERNNSYINNIIINKILDLSNGRYLCVDICYASINEDDFKWIILEINPPFSLDDYEIDFKNYIDFCIDACNYIKES